MSADSSLPDSFDSLARTCEECGEREVSAGMLTNGLCVRCQRERGDGGD